MFETLEESAIIPKYLWDNIPVRGSSNYKEQCSAFNESIIKFVDIVNRSCALNGKKLDFEKRKMRTIRNLNLL